jgi:hypothetical protein
MEERSIRVFVDERNIITVSPLSSVYCLRELIREHLGKKYNFLLYFRNKK